MPSNMYACWLIYFPKWFWDNVKKENKTQGDKNTWGNWDRRGVFRWALRSMLSTFKEHMQSIRDEKNLTLGNNEKIMLHSNCVIWPMLGKWELEVSEGEEMLSEVMGNDSSLVCLFIPLMLRRKDMSKVL